MAHVRPSCESELSERAVRAVFLIYLPITVLGICQRILSSCHTGTDNETDKRAQHSARIFSDESTRPGYPEHGDNIRGCPIILNNSEHPRAVSSASGTVVLMQQLREACGEIHAF